MVYRCGQCEDYETADFDEMLEHKASKIHTYNGTAPCGNCGKANEYNFTGLLAVGSVPSLCKDCAKAILEGSND